MLTRIDKIPAKTLKDYFDYYQFVYGACLKEVIKQVEVECKERGVFLDSLWSRYLNLFEKLIIDQNEKMRQCEITQAKEYIRIHTVYQAQVDVLQR